MEKLSDAIKSLPSSRTDIVSRMDPDDLELLKVIRTMYQNDELTHLTWSQILSVAREQANFPGAKASLKTFFERTDD